MIKDLLKNAETYYGLSENLKKGFEWLKSQDLKNIEPNKYYIDGDRIYANVQVYETKEDANYEAHHEYIDIQYMISGEELVGVCGREDCSVCEEYDKSRDIEFLTCNKDEHYENLRECEFLVLYPQDAHKPSIMVQQKKMVKKVVVKVAIN